MLDADTAGTRRFTALELFKLSNELKFSMSDFFDDDLLKPDEATFINCPPIPLSHRPELREQ